MPEPTLPASQEREHKLGCDEYHEHIAPKCCRKDCWCISDDNPSTPVVPASQEPHPRKWRDLYDRLPADRRAVIEARVQGEIARLEGEPPHCNPYQLDNGQDYLQRAWSQGWGDADDALLSADVLKKEKAR